MVAGWGRCSEFRHVGHGPEEEDGEPEPPFLRQPLEHVEQHGKHGFSPFFLDSGLTQKARLWIEAGLGTASLFSYMAYAV